MAPLANRLSRLPVIVILSESVASSTFLTAPFRLPRRISYRSICDRDMRFEIPEILLRVLNCITQVKNR